MSNRWTVYEGQARDGLAALPDHSAQVVFTSTPYWAKRDYMKGEGWRGGDPDCPHAVRLGTTVAKSRASSTLGCGKGHSGHPHEGFLTECPRCGATRETAQIGLEADPDLFIAKLADVFDEARRVLHPTGTLWVNIADGYAGSGRGPTGKTAAVPQGDRQGYVAAGRVAAYGLADKQLIGLPWRLAFALQQRGWVWRQWLPWVKCLSGGVRLYVRSASGDRPMSVKDLARSKYQDMELWNGERWTRVVGVYETPRPSDALEIELRTGERIGCTATHVWPTQRGNVRTDELRHGDVIAAVRLPESDETKRPAGLDDVQVGWFIGVYLAEGSLGNHDQTIQIAGHTKERERFERLSALAEAYHGRCAMYTSGGHRATINLSGSILRAILDTYLVGRTALDKHLSAACWQRSDDFLRSLLAGYLHGDGHWDEANQRWRLGFANNDYLAADLRTLCARLGLMLRLKRAKLQYNEQPYAGWRGEIRFSRKTDPRPGTFKARPDTEVVAIRRSRGRRFWDIEVADQPHLFALASGVLTHNSNASPENVSDRPNTSVEPLLLFAQRERYFFDMAAARQTVGVKRNWRNGDALLVLDVPTAGFDPRAYGVDMPDHFAVMPLALAETCLAAAAPSAGVCVTCGTPYQATPDGPRPTCRHTDGARRALVVDPFTGSGTTGDAALRLGFDFYGAELNPDYARLARARLAHVEAHLPML